MSKPISLEDYAKELKHAAGTGAAQIATSTTASGRVQAQTGLPIQVPGPGLRSALAKAQDGTSTRTADAVDSSRLPKVADRAAAHAVQQGADLLSGGKQ